MKRLDRYVSAVLRDYANGPRCGRKLAAIINDLFRWYPRS